MKKLRPFLALLLACWLMALPALADDEIGGDTSESPPVSDGVEDAGPSSSEEAPSENPPASEDPPPEREDPPDTSDDTPSFPGDSSDTSEDTPPVVDDPPDITDPDPVDPSPENPIPETPVDPPPEDLEPDLPIDPSDPDFPADPLPENPSPEIPVDPLPENPVPETPVDPAPEIPVDPLPVYPIPDTPVVPPGLQQVPGTITQVGIEETPTAETYQIFTITTIPEFALALMESDAGNTMGQVIRDLFGTYTPRIQTVTTYMNGEPIAVEEQYVPGVAGMDWEWIGGFVVFLLMLYCLFRLLGGSVKYG